ARDDGLIVEREEKRIDKEDPVEAFRRKIRAKFNPVRDGLLDVQTIENRIEILVAFLFLPKLRLLLYKPLQVLRRVVIIWIIEKGLRRGDEFGIVGTQAECRARIRRRDHRIDIRIVSETGMPMIVEDWNRVDGFEQTVIGLPIRSRRRR